MHYSKQLLAFSFLLLICYIVNAQGSNNLDVVKTNAGLVSGATNTDGSIHVFKGIPFAAPPVDELRWKAPQPVTAWTGIKKCNAFGPSPMQASPAPFSMWSAEFLIPKEPISEDCLYLNVWSGATSAQEKRPVLVWIYGGGFNSGGSAVPIYDGEAMAKKGIVFVSINYRVGIFGFFAHPELTKESPQHASGNYGLMDQIAALQWVKSNIAAFGGDPDNVTIAGQSAGAMSVNCLVASPLAKGLFNKAIAESGASFTNNNPPLSAAEKSGEEIMQKFNVTSVEALRNIPAEELMQKAGGLRGPIVDGYVLPQSVATIFAQGKENKVALLTGWNENEGLLFGPVKNAADFQKQLEQQYGADAGKLQQYYPATNDSVANTSQLNLARDVIFGVQNYTWANIASSHGKKVYVYKFIRKVPATGEYVKYGAFHTGEVPYAYDNLKFVNRPWEPADHELAKVMSAYWANFIKSGNPNGDDLPDWKAYTKTSRQVMVLGIMQQTEPLRDAAQLDLLYKAMKGK
ncbi:carboxylesterase family protein [Ilyomonas limi]|uniref:Carboxylic ester hydrolase n=1 Tax=Ilyomonas limi TaxID=2575867 RepID=A0A4U3KT94_9BACT|nr:carboxylesterase family protein [Ilyomonas limi]TKK65550.1 carboxylesterase family protein [Ilyomonas limi]